MREADWKLEAGSWGLEAGDWKLEAGDWKLEAGDWKLYSARSQSALLGVMLSYPSRGGGMRPAKKRPICHAERVYSSRCVATSYQ